MTIALLADRVPRALYVPFRGDFVGGVGGIQGHRETVYPKSSTGRVFCGIRRSAKRCPTELYQGLVVCPKKVK